MLSKINISLSVNDLSEKRQKCLFFTHNTEAFLFMFLHFTGKFFGAANVQNMNREARRNCNSGLKRLLEAHTNMNSEVTKCQKYGVFDGRVRPTEE
uniref:Uncharacterized protein n=1 Tax=Romanomermis culicivorax TaxID=13658 RepID=A0A915L028_ROMCU